MPLSVGTLTCLLDKRRFSCFLYRCVVRLSRSIRDRPTRSPACGGVSHATLFPRSRRHFVLTSRTPGNRSAIVVFVDQTDCAWLRPLKRGFRHCFVALEHRSGWLVCDSLKSHMELIFMELPGLFGLAERYVDQGHQVLVGRTERSVPRPALPLAPLTCVSVAKRALAIRADWVWTPRQLFHHLLHAQPQGWHQVSTHRATRNSLTQTVIEA